MTSTEAALFVGLSTAWIVGRVFLRRWATRHVRLGLLTARSAVFMLAASFAALPRVEGK
ncbi:MAG: hypothetical protein ABIP53_11530 [Candidatus Limnocylindrales bacterium]